MAAKPSGLSVLKQSARLTAISAIDALANRAARYFSRRERRAGADRASWLTDQERNLAEALSGLILPSDADGPGAREADAARTIEASLAGSPDRQAVYIRGLRALDRLARRRAGRPFTNVAEDAQIALLREVEATAEARSRAARAWRLPHRVIDLYAFCRFPEIEFLTQFVDDVFVAYYTSPVGWKWLDYDGPPMPLGYLDPLRRRV
jgi:hypothetical protein